MALFDTKSPFKSLTIWGAFLSLGSCAESLLEALQMVPVEVLPPKAGAAVTAAIGILGAVLSIVGRFKANTKIRV